MSTWGMAGNSEATHLPGRQARRDERSDRERVRVVPQGAVPDINRALSLLPAAMCIMTAAHENRRAGIMVGRVMKCSDEPACVAVAVPTGQKLAMLIRDSHSFALSLVDRSQKLLLRKFGEDVTGGGVVTGGDPFDMLEVRTLTTGSPILARAVMGVDCEVMRHFDLESDYEIYIGLVLGAYFGQTAPSQVISPGRPGEPVFRANGRGHELGHGPADSAK